MTAEPLQSLREALERHREYRRQRPELSTERVAESGASVQKLLEEWPVPPGDASAQFVRALAERAQAMSELQLAQIRLAQVTEERLDELMEAVLELSVAFAQVVEAKPQE